MVGGRRPGISREAFDNVDDGVSAGVEPVSAPDGLGKAINRDFHDAREEKVVVWKLRGSDQPRGNLSENSHRQLLLQSIFPGGNVGASKYGGETTASRNAGESEELPIALIQ